MTEHYHPVTTIDIDALFEPRAEGRAAVSRAVAGALAEQGGFVATGFPGAEDFDARMRNLLSFFELPLDDKMACATRRHDPASSNVNRGYIPTPDERGWAYSEVFDIGPDSVEGVPPDLPGCEILEEPTLWPESSPYIGWQEETRTLYEDLVGLSRCILGVLMEGVGLDPAPALASCRRNNATLRLLHYPPVPDSFVAGEGDSSPERADEFGRRITTHRHIDMNLHSLLWQTPVGGLQIQAPDGTWREVPADGGGVSIHNGALIEALTGGRVKSTPHRVTGSGERSSVGLFHEPDYDAVVTPVGGVPESYARILLRQYAAYEDMAPFVPVEAAV